MDWIFYFWLFITYLGSEYFYLVALTTLYLAVNKRLCYKTAIILFFSMWLNSLLKDIFKLERPPNRLIEVSGYGFPSGHAQNSTTFWGYLAITTQNVFIIVLAIVLIILISYSRLYLNVHYPIDVIGGILIGTLMVFVYYFLSNFLEEKVEKISFGLKVFISGFVPLMLFALYAILFFAEASKDVPRICGAYLGFAVGYLLEEKFIGMLDSHVFKFKVLRCFLGLVIVFTAYLFLSILFPASFYILFIRYALIALLVTVFAPSLIRTLKI